MGARTQSRSRSTQEELKPAQICVCECGFRGKGHEVTDGKCPRCGSNVKAE